MPLTDFEKIELEMALKTVRLLIEQDAAERVSFEWKIGAPPSVVFTPTVPLEYVSVNFTIQDKEKNG